MKKERVWSNPKDKGFILYQRVVLVLLEELLKVVRKGSDNQKLIDNPFQPLVIPPSVTGPKKIYFMLILKCLKVVNLVV
jgi:hypothetical protein